jgi:hypothetical protein
MGLGGLWTLRPAPLPAEPVRLDPRQAEAWMADALPGVGAMGRERVAQALRRGEWATIPARARALALEVFTVPVHPSSAQHSLPLQPATWP